MQSRVTISGNIVSELSEKIPSNIIALNELIKNAYDAGAPSVEVSLDSTKKKLIIKDTGEGMNKSDIDTLFHISNSNKIYGSLNKKYNRYVQGSKGLGFLSVFKFGHKVQWETKKDKGYRFSLDYDSLVGQYDISECVIELIEDDSIEKGTKIEISIDDYNMNSLLDYFKEEKNYKKILNAFDDDTFDINIKIDGIVYKSSSSIKLLDNSDYKKREDIHGTVLYPAVMIAPIQNEVLTELIQKNKITSVFDPFHGSGTALYEAMEIDSNLHLVGCDINPLANLITRVKLDGVSKNIKDSLTLLIKHINNPGVVETIKFPNIEKWFRKDIIETLSIIKAAILQIENDNDRRFFWIMLCDCIRKYSNTRSSTYKLHKKESEKIERIENNLIKDYIKAIEQNFKKYEKCTENYILYKRDVLGLLKELPSRIFDISISSPPYGDNATTVPYGQFSMLDLYIIDKRDLELEGWELDNYSIIDRMSLGGNKKETKLGEFEKGLIKPYLDKISIEKQEKVIRFFNDYFVWLEGLCKVTDKFIVLTLGNRTVDRIKINLTEITQKYLESREFKNIEFAEREIPNKRTPKVTSMVDLKPVDSMTKEYIIVHERRK